MIFSKHTPTLRANFSIELKFVDNDAENLRTSFVVLRMGNRSSALGDGNRSAI